MKYSTCSRMRLAVALIAMLALFLSGAAVAGSDTGSHATSKAGKTDNQGLLAAGRTVSEKMPEATIVGIESEHHDSYWEVEVALPNGERKKLHVSADGKRIEHGPQGSRHDEKSRAKWRRRVAAAKLDYAEAFAKTMDVRKGRVSELEIDDHHDHIVWEADVRADGTKYKVKIDAGTGKLVEDKRD